MRQCSAAEPAKESYAVKWEYKVVNVELGLAAPNVWETQGDGRPLEQELARLGADEWELVAAHSQSPQEWTTYVFKRPLR
jgi:hypothetical protein